MAKLPEFKWTVTATPTKVEGEELYLEYAVDDEAEPLGWWDRWKLRRQFKREARAERKAARFRKRMTRRWERRQARLDRAVIKAARIRERATAKAERQHAANPTLGAAFNAMYALASRDTDRVDHMHAKLNAANAIRTAFTTQRDRRFKYTALIGTWLVALYTVTMLTMCSGCFRPPTYAQPEGSRVRNLEAQRAAAVEITTPCGKGSGVLINETQVLTAYHVVTCTIGDKTWRAPMIIVQDAEGMPYTAVIEAAEPERDLARIRIAANATATVHPVRYALPEVGNEITITAAVPEPAVFVGKVTEMRAIQPFGDISHDAPIWFGNSGSGMYDSQGRLVAVLTSLKWCSDFDKIFWESPLSIEPEHKCGGWGASLLGSKVLP